MTDWCWEYLSSREDIAGGLSPELVAEVEQIAQRLVDAAGVKYLGEPAVEESGVSRLLTFAEGRWLVWYQEHWRRRTVYVVRVHHV